MRKSSTFKTFDSDLSDEENPSNKKKTEFVYY